MSDMFSLIATSMKNIPQKLKCTKNKFPSCTLDPCKACLIIYTKYKQNNYIYGFNDFLAIHKILKVKVSIKTIYSIYSYYIQSYKIITLVDKLLKFKILKQNIFLVIKSQCILEDFFLIKKFLESRKLCIIKYKNSELYLICGNQINDIYDNLQLNSHSIFYNYSKGIYDMHLSINLNTYISSLLINTIGYQINIILRKLYYYVSIAGGVNLPLFLYYDNNIFDIDVNLIDMNNISSQIECKIEYFANDKYHFMNQEDVPFFIKHLFKVNSKYICTNQYTTLIKSTHKYSISNNIEFNIPEFIIPSVNFVN